MVPFVLGGIALATVGYGVYKLCGDKYDAFEVGDRLGDALDVMEDKVNETLDKAEEEIERREASKIDEKKKLIKKVIEEMMREGKLSKDE